MPKLQFRKPKFFQAVKDKLAKKPTTEVAHTAEDDKKEIKIWLVKLFSASFVLVLLMSVVGAFYGLLFGSQEDKQFFMDAIKWCFDLIKIAFGYVIEP